MSGQDTKKKQQERAARMHKQIAELKEGKIPVPQSSKNPRDLIAEKMREIAEDDGTGNDETDE